MKKLFFLVLLVSNFSFGQSLVRIVPDNFTSIYGLGSNGSFTESEIVVSGIDAMPPMGETKLYLFNKGITGITPNGTISSPETNQKFSGGIEMTDDFLFVGSTLNNTSVTNGGAVYVFKKINNNWEYLLKIQPIVQYENDYFGTNIKVNNGQLFISAFGFDQNGNANQNEGAIYVYNQSDEDFTLQQIITGGSGISDFGKLIEIENEMMVTSSSSTLGDYYHTFKKVTSNWELVNTSSMPIISFQYNPEVTVLHSNRVSFTNGKLYLYHLTDEENDVLGQKMIKIYDWSEETEEWNFTENFVFNEGDYYEYKVQVKNNNMFIIPTGSYILQMERKNPVFHYVYQNGSWGYQNTYAGMSNYTNDSFGFFTLIKNNEVLFGNSSEYWTNPIASPNGGAYLLDATLSIQEFDSNDIIFYPNPTNGHFTISAKNVEIISIEIYDALSKKVFESKSITSTLDITNLKAGIYFCRILDSDNNVNYQKIIKR